MARATARALSSLLLRKHTVLPHPRPLLTTYTLLLEVASSFCPRAGFDFDVQSCHSKGNLTTRRLSSAIHRSKGGRRRQGALDPRAPTPPLPRSLSKGPAARTSSIKRRRSEFLALREKKDSVTCLHRDLHTSRIVRETLAAMTSSPSHLLSRKSLPTSACLLFVCAPYKLSHPLPSLPSLKRAASLLDVAHLLHEVHSADPLARFTGRTTNQEMYQPYDIPRATGPSREEVSLSPSEYRLVPDNRDFKTSNKEQSVLRACLVSQLS